MSEEQTSVTPASLPDVEAVAKMSPSQVDVALGKFGADAAAYSKLFSGDGQARKLFDRLIERREQLATAESLIAAAEDPAAPQPTAGGVLHNGISKRDEVEGARWQLEGGASLEELAEREVGAPFVGPEDYRIVERVTHAGCHNNPEFVKAYLSGNSAARKIMDEWHWTKITSQPWPPVPRFGIAK